MKPTPLLIALLLVFFSFSARALTEEEVNNYLRQTIIPDYTVANMPAGEALDGVQVLANLNQNGIFFNIAARDKIKKGMVTLSLKNAPAYDIIAAICSLCEVKFVIKKDQVLIFQAGGDAGL